MIINDIVYFFIFLVNLFLLIKILTFLKENKKITNLNNKNYKLPMMIHRRIKIHNKFNEEEKQKIHESLKTWNKITCGLFDYTIIEETASEIDLSDGYNTIVFLKCSPKESLIRLLDSQEKNKIYGYAYQNCPNVILIVPKRLNSLMDFKKILVHEIGHMLNISHIRDKRSLMHPYYNGNNKITENDLIAFLSVCQWDYEFVKFDKDPFWIKRK